MIFETFRVPGLGCNSYLVGDDGEAIVVDPQRDIDVYLDAAKRLSARIVTVVETHLHADHVSGGCDLAVATGAALLLHEAARATFKHRSLKDGEILRVGGVTLEVLHTPGHTPESVCLLLRARELLAPVLLSGDTLFVGDVGRPDLTGDEAAHGLASMLYDSLFQRLLSLPDDVVVHPAHGEGSLCGSRAIGGGSTTTIGQERRVNHALQPTDMETFVDRIVGSLPEPPADFHRIKLVNRTGPPRLSGPPRPKPIAPAEARRLINGGASVLDARSTTRSFGEAHLPGSVYVPPEGPFATRAAWFTPRNTPLILVVDSPDAAVVAARALSRVGVDDVVGYLDGGVDAWRAASLPTEALPQASPQAIAKDSLSIVDVREAHEWQRGHVAGAMHVPLGRLAERLESLERSRPLAIQCASGSRSTIASSFLKSRGFTNVWNATGGFAAWSEAGQPVEAG